MRRFVVGRGIAVFLVGFAALTVSRGFWRSDDLAGHDAAAYAITQAQFHENVREGVLFPRWAPDMRYGRGHPKLQYRPPVLHYLAEPFLIASGNPMLALNIAMVSTSLIAAYGTYVFARTLIAPMPAALAAVSFVSCGYLMGDLYVRGAYYEVVACSFVPWVLWSQSRLIAMSAGRRPPWRACVWMVVGTLAWTGLICGHPQIALFFSPLLAGHVWFRCWLIKRWRGVSLATLQFVAGALISAPYVYVAWRELPLVRMRLFQLNLESYLRHFLSVDVLLTESWPMEYVRHTGAFDWLNRPIHREARGLGVWALTVLLATPVFWFVRLRRDGRFYVWSQFFLLWFLLSVFMCLPMSWFVWDAVDILWTFNFPWRALTVASFCLSILFGLLIDLLARRTLPMPMARGWLYGFLVVMLFAGIHRRGAGWASERPLTLGDLTRDAISRQAGVPQRFYTPRWVVDYPRGLTTPAALITEGRGDVAVVERGATTWRLTVRAETPVTLVARQHFYPGWRLVDSDGDSVLTPEPWGRAGLMAFNIPRGDYRFALKFGSTFDRVLAWWMCALGVALLGVGGLAAWRFESAAFVGN